MISIVSGLFSGLFGVMILMEVLFVVMTMMHVMVLPTVGGTNKVAEMQLNFWREKLPSVQVPETVAAGISPLTQDEVSAFVKIIKGGNLHFHATQFCKSANLLCSQSIPLKTRRVTQCPYSYVESDKISDMFFSIKELREGGQITLPELYRPWKAFLPRNLSQLIPFATVALSEVIASFGFWERSNMTKNMNNTLITCEDKPLQGELKMCTTSIEGMIEFVVSTLGSSSDNVQLFSHPAVTGDFGKKARVSKVVERLSGPSNRPPLVCHRSVYPYGVFYCHSFTGTLTFTMELEVSEKNGNIYNATAVCHPDVQSKRLDYCHLILGDTLLWLAKDRR